LCQKPYGFLFSKLTPFSEKTGPAFLFDVINRTGAFKGFLKKIKNVFFLCVFNKPLSGKARKPAGTKETHCRRGNLKEETKTGERKNC
jgi:hypothetical protein